MLQAITFMHPDRLPAILAGVLMIVIATLVFSRKYGLKTTLYVLVFRLVMLTVLGFALLTPSKLDVELNQFQPVESWVFHTDSEPPEKFLNRLRLAVNAGNPPKMVSISTDATNASKLYTAVGALGVPVEVVVPQNTFTQQPMLLGFDIPKQIQPGEPLEGKLRSAGGGVVRLSLDGTEVELTDGKFHAGYPKSGLHVLAARLEIDGQIVQKIGAVVEVGEPTAVLAIGLTQKQIVRMRELLPNSHIRLVEADAFSSADLRNGNEPAAVAVCSIKAGAELTAKQADALQMFVARGGGLFVTGDGAKQVVVKYISDDFKELLPVILQAEKQDPPEDPKVKETPGIEEIAKVSLLFVVDRSTSMTAITSTGATRWAVAVKSIEGSLSHVSGKGDDRLDESIATRVGIMAFTLKQNWLTADGEGENKKAILQTFLFESDRKRIINKLKALHTEDDAEDYTDAGFNTDIYAAMDDAIKVMSDEPSSVRMIVMLTDGGDNPENVVKGKVHRVLRERAIANEINIVTVGIGAAFKADNPDSRAANRVLTELATKGEFVHLTDGETTPAIFVDAVSTAFKAYDKKKEEEENARKEKRDKDNEPENVDVLPGVFPMLLTEFGSELFGQDAIPEAAPKVAWFARNKLRKTAAVAIALQEESNPSALSFRAHGLGRVGFWATGTKQEALGEAASWDEFPALFAASVRWLMPRADVKLELLGNAEPQGIQLLDPTPDAEYVLKTKGDEIILTLTDDQLSAKTDLPVGAATVVERIDGAENEIGHVFVADKSQTKGAVWLDPVFPVKPELQAGKSIVTETKKPDISLILYAMVFFLIVLPFERVARRRQ